MFFGFLALHDPLFAVWKSLWNEPCLLRDTSGFPAAVWLLVPELRVCMCNAPSKSSDRRRSQPALPGACKQLQLELPDSRHTEKMLHGGWTRLVVDFEARADESV